LAERANGSVGAALNVKAGQGASGVLEINGDPYGAIYLDQGMITFASASWCPDIGTRVRGLAGTPEPDRDGPEYCAELVNRGFLTSAELQAVVRSVIVDAVTVLTVPLSEKSSLSGISFGGPRRHWADGFCRLEVAAVRAEAAGRARHMIRREVLQRVLEGLRGLG
jgi:hypothetical protein